MKRYRSLVCSLIFALGLTSAYAQFEFPNEAAAELFENALIAAEAENYSLAIEQMRLLAELPDLVPSTKAMAEDQIVTYMVLMQDYTNALAQVQSMLEREIGNVYKNISNCIRLLQELGRIDFSATCVSIVPHSVDESLIDFPG